MKLLLFTSHDWVLRNKSFYSLFSNLGFFFICRVLAFDFETLQFIADFKTTDKDPNALYFVSSRFQRFFLKNVNPYEINTRIMRIGNVAQSSPSHSLSQGIPAIPQYDHNSLVPFTLPNVVPSPTPSFTFPTSSSYHHPSSIPASSSSYSPSYQQPLRSSAFSQSVMPKPGYSLYNYAQHFPQKSFFPTSPSYSPTSSPLTLHQNPVRSFFKHRSTAPYTFEHFGVVDKSNSYPFQQLNAGETLPQPNSMANLNFGFAGEVYRPNRFARNPSQNATSYYWLSREETVTLRFTLEISSPSPSQTSYISPLIHAIPSV